MRITPKIFVMALIVKKMKTYYGRHRFSLCQSWSTSEETRKEAQGKVIYKFMIKIGLQNIVRRAGVEDS